MILDGYTLLFLIAIGLMILGVIVQGVLNSRFRKYSRIPTLNNKAARDVVQEIAYNKDCNVKVAAIAGSLTDNFNPRTGTISLSESVYGSSSVAAVAVAAHELGHALQHKEGYAPIAIRNAILPVANLGARFAPFIIIIGIFMDMVGLSQIGIYLYAAALAFQIATLPVEFNASRRAIALLTEGGYIQHSEVGGARKVLSMAAMTYVIATLSTLVTLLRFILIVSGSRRRD